MPPKTILLVHNRYQCAGGEDSVFESEKEVLAARGHTVVEYTADNHSVARLSKAKIAANLIWAHDSNRALAAVIREHAPDIVHFHNIYYLIGPSAYYICKDRNIPVVQTLHNFRMGCINARLSRDGAACEQCQGQRFRWRGIVRRCFQESLLKSAALTFSVDLHRLLFTWQTQVDIFVALSNFARGRHVAAGVPESRIVVKPNCVASDPGIGAGEGGYCLFVGRLERDKGVEVLLESVQRWPSGAELVLVGDGPLAEMVAAASRRCANIRWLGAQPRPEVLSFMKRARLLVFPTLAYENFPVVIAEAFATGLPVVGSDFGATSELIEHGSTGALFKPGDARDLADTITRLLADPALLASMRVAARAQYELKYNSSKCYAALIAIYESAAQRARRC